MHTDHETAGEARASRRLLRRPAAVVAAAALATAVLPVTTASAAPTGSAALIAESTKVFPGAGENLTVNVTNGGTRLLGETINWVDIKLPNTAGFKTNGANGIAAPSGWTATVTNAGGLQTYTFRGGSLAPGSTGAFTFPALVAQPNADRTGVFEVAVSSDNGKTSSGAGSAQTLSSLVQTLQIVPGSLKPVAPAGVTDGVATTKQDIDYAFQVKNLAKAQQTVTPKLTSPNGTDTVTARAAQPVAANGTATFITDVLLGDPGSRTFSAAATAGPSAADAVSSPAFNVLAAVGLDVVPGFTPTASRGDVTRDVTVKVSKTGAQTLTSGAQLELKLDGGPALVTKTISGVSFAAGSVTQDVTFPGVVLGGLGAALPNGVYDATVTLTGTDENGAPVSYTETLNDVLTIDNIDPDIIRLDVTYPNDADGVRQTAASNQNDAVSVTGELAQQDCSATLSTLRVTAGAQSFDLPITKNGCAFSGSFTTGRDITFDPGTTGFTVTAAAKDAAQNTGSEATSGLVDIVAPAITTAVTLGSSADSTNATKIAVQFFDTVPVAGGCTPSQWDIDGELLVTEVQYSDGSRCTDAGAPADNIRVLLLNAPRDQDLQTNVTYRPGTRPFARPAKDGAGQDAAGAVVETVSGVVPNAPQLLTVTRNGGGETATLSEGKYFTRFTGNDLKVSFLNGRTGYTVRVLDGNGTVINSAPLGNANSDGSHTVAVPVSGSDGSYARSLQLVNGKLPNGQDRASALTSLTVQLDRAAPLLQEVAKTGDKQATVTFTELLAGGTDFAEDWFVTEVNRDQDPSDPDDDTAFYQVGNVTGSGATRVLNTNSTLADLGPIGALYTVRNPDSARYIDRAGNPLANASK